MDNTTKTKRHPVGIGYMAFRSDCPVEHARAAFERRHGCAPAEVFVDAENGSVKVGPVPNRKATT